jgi:hypothetical protein
MEVSCHLYAPAVSPPGKELQVLLDRRLGGPQSRYGRVNEEKKIPVPARIRTVGRPARSLATTLTELKFARIIRLRTFLQSIGVNSVFFYCGSRRRALRMLRACYTNSNTLTILM